MVLLLSVVLLLIPQAFAIVENETLAVTSNSPVVYGSTVVFHAEVLQGTGALQDEKRFRFEWKSDVFKTDVETTFANFNSSVRKCYAFVEPGSYNMTVTVWDHQELSSHKVGVKKVGFELTAPVGNYFVFGKQKLHVGEGTNLTIIWQSGSPPFTLSWQLLSGNGTTLINASKHVLLTTSANISVPAKPLASPGSYNVLIQVENMVSLLKRNHTLQVKDRNTPDSASHSPFIIVLSVTGGLVFMTIAVMIFVKVRQHQENHQHIETADFDFHPELHSQSYSLPDEPPATFAAWVKGVVKKLGAACASDGNTRGGVNGSVNSYEGTKNKRLKNYGSLTDSVNDSIYA
ncbi:hypothetical protein MAR_029116 [Mya arenaria]|uniref:Uncharacterized protein n=1 Tax=Mya arenaria TaxID=6604 RepID=A0ABY7DIJ2_MYAAR|nr:hypothetical protein MAR_029116 [Mya arenaria]